MMRFPVVFAVVASLGTVAGVAQAGVTTPTFLVGISAGGDDLVSTSGADLDAGGLLYFGAGLSFEPHNSPFVYRGTIGIKYNFVDFESPDGESKLTSLPIDFVGLYQTGRTMFGVGIVREIGPEWELCINNCATVEFDDATGYVLEFDYQLTETGFWGLRYTDLDYEVGGSEVDASSLRLHFGAWIN